MEKKDRKRKGGKETWKNSDFLNYIILNFFFFVQALIASLIDLEIRLNKVFSSFLFSLLPLYFSPFLSLAHFYFQFSPLMI